jgi:hypothetical protein
MTRPTPADTEHVETDMDRIVARRIAADVYRLLCDDLIRRGVERSVAADNMASNLLRIVKGTLLQLAEKDGLYPRIKLPARR